MTSDSMSTRPRIRLPRISPAALGFRAMPSTAALRPLAWPSAPKAAAKASAKPPVMIDHWATTFLAAFAPSAAASCACRGDVNATAARATIANTKSFLLTSPPENYPITKSLNHGSLDFACGHFTVFVLLVLRCDGPAQVNRREQHEDECLKRRGDEAEEHHRQRHEKGNDAEEDQNDQILAEDVAEQPQRQRQYPREMADDLDRQHDRREKDRR